MTNDDSEVVKSASSRAGVSVFSVRTVDKMYTNIAFFLSPSSACSQTDTDQFHNAKWILRALTSGSKQALREFILTASLVETSAVIL